MSSKGSELGVLSVGTDSNGSASLTRVGHCVCGGPGPAGSARLTCCCCCERMGECGGWVLHYISIQLPSRAGQGRAIKIDRLSSWRWHWLSK